MLYASSAAPIAIGPLCGLGSWYEEQSIGSVSGSMIIQAVGAAAYFIGRALSSEPAGFWVSWILPKRMPNI